MEIYISIPIRCVEKRARSSSVLPCGGWSGDGGRSSRPLLGACPVKVNRFESKLNDILNKDYSTTKLSRFFRGF